MPYTIGLDYGTNSVRCIIVNVVNGQEIATAIHEYETGQAGIILDKHDHNVARQHPGDYIKGFEVTVKEAICSAQKVDKDFLPQHIIGIGVDTTGSTPLPVNAQGEPLGIQEKFKNNPNAQAWLWKDHTSYAEAAEITELAEKNRPEYLAKCGGTYSSEWFFSKILHCLRIDPEVFDEAYTWVEYCDYITGMITGTSHPDNLKRSRCAAGHKAMFNEDWGGYPARDFLEKLDPKLAALRDRLPDKTYTVSEIAGNLTEEWAKTLGLPAGIPVAISAFDAHLGAIGAGVNQGKLVKIIGTSTCDIIVASKENELADIPGVCGIVDGSVLPDTWGLEAGQSAVGDIFNWFVNVIQPGKTDEASHEYLNDQAAKLKPGQSGLLALDWNNGNRTILVDQRLTGLLIGQTLHTRPEEVYRALIEATAFGALAIINRFEEYGVKINEVINCGGIAEKSPLLMQIYADVTGREMKISQSSQTCALGSAIAAAVVAGKSNGGYDSFTEAQSVMAHTKETTYKPITENHKIYKQLYKLYSQLHDAFGLETQAKSMHNIMKELLDIKEKMNA